MLSLSRTVKKQPNIVLLLGTSSVGKSTVTRGLARERSDVRELMVDKVYNEIFKELLATPYHDRKYELKDIDAQSRTRTAERALELSRTPGQCIVIDDTEPTAADTLREHGHAVTVIMLYASLHALAERANSRKGSDGRRPLKGVLRDFTDLYTTNALPGCARAGAMRASDVTLFLKAERNDKINVEKLAASALRRLGFRKDAIASDEERPLYTRTPVDVVVNTDALDSAAVLRKVSEQMPPQRSKSMSRARERRRTSARARARETVTRRKRI